jgi:hypothetical protein
MAETTPMPTSNQVSAEQDYRPLSGLAIASLIVSVLFALIVLVVGGKALFAGEPFDLPLLLMVLPIVGVGLAVAALWQIRIAEGTRAGAGLAKVGGWLSLLFGLGYIAYALAGFWAVRGQAEAFLLGPDEGPDTGFFAKLANPARVNVAFLMTRPPDVRSASNPDNQKEMEEHFNRTSAPLAPGHLGNFREHFLVRFIQNGGDATKIHVRSINRCAFMEGGYRVDMDVEIDTPEITLLVPFTVRSLDVSGQGRKWFVDWTKTPPRFDGSLVEQVKPWGEEIRKLRVSACRFATRFGDLWKAGQVDDVLKMTADPAAFKPGGPAIDLKLVTVAEKRETVRKELDKLFDPRASDRVPIGQVDVTGPDHPMAFYEKDKKTGRLLIQVEFRFRFMEKEGVPAPKEYFCIGRLKVEQTPAATKEPDWRVVGLQVVNVLDTADLMRGPGNLRAFPIGKEPPKP